MKTNKLLLFFLIFFSLGNCLNPFSDENEEETKHQLYKEYNFCLEPSQMTDNGNGTQTVAFETEGSVTVTATYEIPNKTRVTVTKPSNVSFATINITGRKKEMEWNVANPQPSSLSVWPEFNNKSVEYDGTTCYLSGKEKILESVDLGKSWKVAANIPSSRRSSGSSSRLPKMPGRHLRSRCWKTVSP